LREISCETLFREKEYKLSLELLGGSSGLGNPLRSSRIQKPGLALAGYVKQIRPNRVQVLGTTEMRYLAGLSPEEQKEAIDRIFDLDVACFIVTKGQDVDEEFIKMADEKKIPLFKTTLTSRLLIERIERYLEDCLSPTTHMHAVLVDVMGVGILLRGPSGVGKSECAMDLVLRGHRLVADDIVQIRLAPPFKLIGRGAGLIRYHMELRGLGVLNIQDLFGITSIRAEKDINLVVDLEPWDEAESYDRLGVDEKTFTILDIEVPHLIIPVAPGRNIASVVEVAARNHLLKSMGHNSAIKLKERLEESLSKGGE